MGSLRMRTLCVLVLIALWTSYFPCVVASTSPLAAAQSSSALQVWVHPIWGVDVPVNDLQSQAYVNDPDKTFRTLQRAIDVLHVELPRPGTPQTTPISMGSSGRCPGSTGPTARTRATRVFPSACATGCTCRGWARGAARSAA